MMRSINVEWWLCLETKSIKRGKALFYRHRSGNLFSIRSQSELSVCGTPYIENCWIFLNTFSSMNEYAYMIWDDVLTFDLCDKFNRYFRNYCSATHTHIRHTFTHKVLISKRISLNSVGFRWIETIECRNHQKRIWLEFGMQTPLIDYYIVRLYP